MEQNRYAIQTFHDAGMWQTLGAYRNYPTAASAMAEAASLASGRNGKFAFPLGLRVVGNEYRSPVIGGRPNVHILHNPVTERWIGRCDNCPEAVAGDTAYPAVDFARRHVCGNEPEPVHEGRTIRMAHGTTRRG